MGSSGGFASPGDAVRDRWHRRLGEEAWAIADSLRWSRTYDAEYLALAALFRVPIATFDQRVARAAERVGIPIHIFA